MGQFYREWKLKPAKSQVRALHDKVRHLCCVWFQDIEQQAKNFLSDLQKGTIKVSLLSQEVICKKEEGLIYYSISDFETHLTLSFQRHNKLINLFLTGNYSKEPIKIKSPNAYSAVSKTIYQVAKSLFKEKEYIRSKDIALLSSKYKLINSIPHAKKTTG